jgi:hypothetical protein
MGMIQNCTFRFERRRYIFADKLEVMGVNRSRVEETFRYGTKVMERDVRILSVIRVIRPGQCTMQRRVYVS